MLVAGGQLLGVLGIAAADSIGGDRVNGNLGNISLASGDGQECAFSRG